MHIKIINKKYLSLGWSREISMCWYLWPENLKQKEGKVLRLLQIKIKLPRYKTIFIVNLIMKEIDCITIKVIEYIVLNDHNFSCITKLKIFKLWRTRSDYGWMFCDHIFRNYIVHLFLYILYLSAMISSMFIVGF